MADMVTSKLIFNRVLSNPYENSMRVDIKNFYLNMLMARYEYMRLPIDIIPQEIIDEYHIMDKVKMSSSCVEYNEECMEFNRKE